MATVYPSASGNWSDTSLWMEVGGNPYNQIPQIDDVVYLNGCTMTANMNIDLGTNGEIRNDGDDGQGISAGGYVTLVANRSYTANFYAYNDHILYGSISGTTITIIGNIYAENVSTYVIHPTNWNSYWSITGNIIAINSNVIYIGTGQRNITINGDVTLTGSVLCFGTRLEYNGSTTFAINGDVNSDLGSNLFNAPQQSSSSYIRINGDITCCDFYTGNVVGNLEITGNIIKNNNIFVSGSIANFSVDGNLTNVSGNFVNSYITTFNMNGTLTQGQGQIASYITTLNLDGTLNLSGTRPFTTGVQNLNIATGGQVTYDNHLYYCFTNIVAVDSNFTITCRNQNLDNFDFKNKNLLNNTYPSQANVSDGYVYGLEDQFTGSYQLPPESVVLEGTPYGSHVGTLTLDISSSVQDTIDDIEDEVNILVDSYPPLVTLESITNIANTSATINLSVSNTALITKTGAEVDTDWNFSNPYEYEVNNWATSVNVTGLNPSVQYYVRGYVIYDGNKVYSSANTLQTLLLPPELQLCEYLQTDGNCWINIRTDEFPLNNYSLEVKYKTANGNEQGIWGCVNGTTMYFRSIFIGSNNSTQRVSYGNTNVAFGGDSRNTAYQEAIHYLKNNTLKVTNWSGTVLKSNTATMSSLTAKNLTLFGVYNITSDTVTTMLSGGRIISSNFTTFDQISRLVSTYVKTGETYVDNKGNTCSADTAGMCDILTGTFYTNDGGGNFTHGNDII